MSGKTHRNSLKKGYGIGPYEIIEILGQGGFGITYLAMDLNLNRKVAVKEYLPVDLAVRAEDTFVFPVSGDHSEQFNWGLERFISEAQTLARFKHPNIVSVLTVIRENNTAYLVMEYEHGYPFSDLLKGKKTLAETQLKNILFPVMEGLESVHNAGFIHRDIKPPNIYIREDHSPVLIDFGSARQSLLEYTRTLTTMVSPGFAPFEQYVGKSDKQGPWTDIYGLGATLYRAVAGLSPADAMERSEALLHTGSDIYVPAAELAAGQYSPAFLAAIDRAMAFKAEDRPQSIAEWRRAFEQGGLDETVSHKAGEVTTLVSDMATVKIDAPQKQGMFNTLMNGLNRILWKSVGLGLLLIILLVIVRVILPGNQRNADGNRTVPESVSQTGPQTTDEKSTTAARDSAAPGVNTGAGRPPADDGSQDGEQIISASAYAPETEPQVTENNPGGTDAPVSGEPDRDAAQTTGSIPIADRRRLALIRNRLHANRQDPQARRELRDLAGEFEENIRQAVNRGEYDLARAYLYEVQKNTAKNTQAYSKLDDLLTIINKMEKQQDQ